MGDEPSWQWTQKVSPDFSSLPLLSSLPPPLPSHAEFGCEGFRRIAASTDLQFTMRPSVRFSAVLWLVVLLAFLIYFISHVVAFVQIFYTHAGISLPQAEAAEAYKNGTADRVQYIPRIIHQVFHNWKDPGSEVMPSDWDNVRQTCIDKNPGWEYKVRWPAAAAAAVIQ